MTVTVVFWPNVPGDQGTILAWHCSRGFALEHSM